MPQIPSVEVAEEILVEASFSIVDQVFMDRAIERFDAALQKAVICGGFVSVDEYENARSLFFSNSFVPKCYEWLDEDFPNGRPPITPTMICLGRRVYDFTKFVYGNSLDLYSVFESFVEIARREGLL